MKRFAKTRCQTPSTDFGGFCAEGLAPRDGREMNRYGMWRVKLMDWLRRWLSGWRVLHRRLVPAPMKLGTRTNFLEHSTIYKNWCVSLILVLMVVGVMPAGQVTDPSQGLRACPTWVQLCAYADEFDPSTYDDRMCERMEARNVLKAGIWTSALSPNKPSTALWGGKS